MIARDVRRARAARRRRAVAVGTAAGLMLAAGLASAAAATTADTWECSLLARSLDAIGVPSSASSGDGTCTAP